MLMYVESAAQNLIGLIACETAAINFAGLVFYSI